MTSERYEKRHRKLEFLTGDREKIQEHFRDDPDEPIPQEYLGKCYSFFVKKSHGQKFDIDGRVFIPEEARHEIELETSEVFNKVIDKIFTKQLTKGKRQTPRKEFLEMQPYEVYSWIALMNYVRQSFVDGEEKVLLSRKEFAMIQPKESKKAKLKRETRNIGVQY